MARGECWLPAETTAGLVPLDGGEGPAALHVGWGRISCGDIRFPAKAEPKPILLDGGEGPAAFHVGCGRMFRGTSELLVAGGEDPAALHIGWDRISCGAPGLPAKAETSGPAAAGVVAEASALLAGRDWMARGDGPQMASGNLSISSRSSRRPLTAPLMIRAIVAWWE
ncbi:hypothetical protein HRG_013578 [Hirsutella rhossiliensis]